MKCCLVIISILLGACGKNSNSGSTAGDFGSTTIISGPSGPSVGDTDSPFRSLTVHPTNPNIVLLGTEANGFVRTTDGGTTWTRHREGLRDSGTAYPEIYDIAYAPSDPNIVYAATVDSPGPPTGPYPSALAGV